jgi:hypothetical protein
LPPKHSKCKHLEQREWLQYFINDQLEKIQPWHVYLASTETHSEQRTGDFVLVVVPESSKNLAKLESCIESYGCEHLIFNSPFKTYETVLECLYELEI